MRRLITVLAAAILAVNLSACSTGGVTAEAAAKEIERAGFKAPIAIISDFDIWGHNAAIAAQYGNCRLRFIVKQSGEIVLVQESGTGKDAIRIKNPNAVLLVGQYPETFEPCGYTAEADSSQPE